MRATRTRRGISAVIGGIFMVLLIAGAVNMTIWSIQQQNQVTGAIIQKANSNLAQLNEKIAVSDLRITNNKLNITTQNTGGTAANIQAIYVVNKTSNTEYRYSVNYVVDGKNSVTNIGQNIPFTVYNNAAYSVRLVTQAGNTATASYTPLSQLALPMALYAIPPTVQPNDNITLLYTVTNNVTSTGNSLTVTPTMSTSMSCSPPGPSCQLTPVVTPSATTIARGNTALFKWVYTVNAPDMTTLTFNASLVGAKNGNYVIEKGSARLVQASQTSFQSDQLVSSTLVQRPEIFAMFPNPFGISNQNGIWGVAVANPTLQPMNVTKIIITVTSPRGQSNDKIFDTSDGKCNPQTVSPTGTNYWTCPGVNMIQWRKTSGYIINGPSAMAFLSSVAPGSLSRAGDLPAFNIDITVFTNMGQFAKSGYASSIQNTGSMPNVYLSSAVNSTVTSNMVGNYTGLKSGTTKTFNATIANLDTSGSYKINSGSRLVIDIPKCFSNVQVLHSNDFNLSGPTQYSDGSWQIIGTLKHDLTGISPNAARTIQFSTTIQTQPQSMVYIMYVLGDGDLEGATAFPIGPLSEVPMQVTP